jgi:hypothetical protein
MKNTGEYTFLKINREPFRMYLGDEENSRRRFIGRRRDSEGDGKGCSGDILLEIIEDLGKGLKIAPILRV